MSVGVLTVAERYVEVRGEVVACKHFDTLAWVNQPARRYTAAAFTRGVDWEPRYKVVIPSIPGRAKAEGSICRTDARLITATLGSTNRPKFPYTG